MECDENLEIYKSFKSESVPFIQYNWTLLHLAVWFSNKSLVESLLKHKYEVNVQDVVISIQHGDTPLHLAAYQNNQEIYELLVDNYNDQGLKNKVKAKKEDKTASELFAGFKC